MIVCSRDELETLPVGLYDLGQVEDREEYDVLTGSRIKGKYQRLARIFNPSDPQFEGFAEKNARKRTDGMVIWEGWKLLEASAQDSLTEWRQAG